MDYTPLAKHIVENCRELILIGQTADKIEKVVLKELEKTHKKLGIHKCNSLEQTVILANRLANKGDVILFSPASASFDMFKNFAERGNKFKEIAKEKIK